MGLFESRSVHGLVCGFGFECTCSYTGFNCTCMEAACILYVCLHAEDV